MFFKSYNYVDSRYLCIYYYNNYNSLVCCEHDCINFCADQEIKIIKSAMRHWEENTCIRFRPKVSSDIYYIFIMSGPTGV